MEADAGGDAGAADDGGLAAAGVSSEELASCVDVLLRLGAARDTLDFKSTKFRELRKALALHNQEAFSNLPQKHELDKKKRDKFSKDLRREQQQKQQEADRRWRDNAELRSGRLAKLEAIEAASVAAAIKDGYAGAAAAPVALLDGDVAAHTEAVVPKAEEEAARRQEDDIDEADKAADREEEVVGQEEYSQPQACYICKVRFRKRHHFYATLCPSCSDLNFMKRHQAVDLTGRICLVTGARVKIGFETTLKLLRMGATVIATTRFPCDAARRFGAEKDADSWSSRLEIWGVDFRFLPKVEGFCNELIRRHGWLDVLINNACQTIRRPAGYYRHLLDGEEMPILDGNHGLRPLSLTAGGSAASSGPVISEPSADEVPTTTPSSRQPSPDVSNAVTSAINPQAMSSSDSAAMSQLTVLPEDSWSAEEAEAVLPAGKRDEFGQQLDLRDRNSWLLKLGEVSTPEAVEAMCINALAPFILNGHLRPLLERSPHPDRYVVNVSAMEGKFYRWKQPTHPHTNMAKAALNMMTKTSAEDYARSGIYMTAVDTGWINDENPVPTAQRIAADHGFQTPIDEVDAAARIVDPVVTGVQCLLDQKASKGGDSNGDTSKSNAKFEGPVSGKFLKDYMQTEW